MKLRHLYALAGLLANLLIVPLAHAIPFTFHFATKPSGGNIAAQPGQLVGWGYDLTNADTTDWFMPTQLSASSFSIGTPDAGYFDFPILAPGATASVAFDATTMAGLYGLQVFSFATAGMSDSGLFTLSGEWWSGDPLAGGTLLRTADAVSTPFAVLVPAQIPIPLPGSALLLGSGLGLLWLSQRHRQKVQQRRAGPG